MLSRTSARSRVTGANFTASNTSTKGHDCVLLVASDEDAAARVLGELGSVTEERFEVEWVTELSRGIERLSDGGVGAVVLDLNLSDSTGVETFDKLFQAAPGVPILILSDADTEGEARQAV
jgi:DNA-binding response OmpR family regulator